MNPYITVADKGTGEIVEKRSRFIANVFPIKTEAEAIDIINSLKKEYWDARHNVYAYTLREGNICRYSDDGEPSGTAGVPTLDVLKKRNIVDCLVVVTRYFGGVLLGTGGLVRAYTAAANEGLEKARVITMQPCLLGETKCTYGDYDSFLRLAQSHNIDIRNSEFQEDITLSFAIEFEETDKFRENLKNQFCGRMTFEIKGECYIKKE